MATKAELEHKIEEYEERFKLIVDEQASIVKQLFSIEALVLNIAMGEGYADVIEENGEQKIKLYKTKKPKSHIVQL